MRDSDSRSIEPIARRVHLARTQTRGRTLAVLALLGWCTQGCAAGLAGSVNNAAQLNTSPAIKASIPIGPGPIFLATSPDGSRLYAAANDGLHIVDTANRAVVASLATQPNPAGLTVAAGGTRAFLTNLFSIKLSVIDTQAQTLLDPIDLLSSATRPTYGRVVASRDAAVAYVVDKVGQNLVVVDTNRASPQLYQLGITPSDVALSPDGRWAYVCGCKGFCTPGNVQRFDTQQKRFADSFSVGSSPYRIAFHPDGKWLYTANLGDGSVSVVEVDDLTLVASVPVAAQLTDLAVSNDGKWILAVSRATNQLGVIDTGMNLLRGTMSVGPTPREVVLSPDGRTAYVSTADSVVVIDTEKLISGQAGS